MALQAEITVPPGTGNVVSAQWDLDGKGGFPVTGEINSAGQEKVIVKLSHAYTAPGTYFPTLRAASDRQGDAARHSMPVSTIWAEFGSLSHRQKEAIPEGCTQVN